VVAVAGAGEVEKKVYFDMMATDVAAGLDLMLW